jgi:hypothetical protein
MGRYLAVAGAALLVVVLIVVGGIALKSALTSKGQGHPSPTPTPTHSGPAHHATRSPGG